VTGGPHTPPIVPVTENDAPPATSQETNVYQVSGSPTETAFDAAEHRYGSVCGAIVVNLLATVADTVLSDGPLLSRGGRTSSASMVAAVAKSTAEDVLYIINPYPPH